MRRFYQTLSLLLVLGYADILLAQTSTEVNFQPPAQRIPLNLLPGANRLTVKGLEPGKIHSIIAVGGYPEQEAEFRVRMQQGEEEARARSISREDRPQWRRFVAAGSSVDIVVDISSTLPEVFMYLSVDCEDCERDDAWFNPFKDKIESGAAVLSVVPGVGASSLITNTLIGGDCFDVSGITSSGNTNSRGTFANGQTSINIANGMVLCTGHVNILPGPNNEQNANNGFNNNSADDADLATLTNGNQWDVTKIEFDFTPTADMVEFEFVFGSEEYCEFVNTQFNDVFGFFVSGPGITGNQNLAIIPNTSTPITINDVNHIDNSQYYVNNNTWSPCQNLSAQAPGDIELDGYTTVLTATANLIPCETYHIKLAIADVADGLYASAVFLKANSFNAGGTAKAQSMYPSGQNFVYEGCDGGFIRFFRSGGNPNEPIVINYTIGGNSTATPGDDYEPLSGSVTIPPNTNWVDVPVNVFADLIVEGNETIIIMLENACSCELQEFEFVIADKPPLIVEMEDQIICGGNSATLAPEVSGGIAPYTYNWSNGSTGSSVSVSGNGVHTYTVTVTDDCGTTDTATATVTIQPQPTANLVGNGALCAGAPDTVLLTLTLTGEAPWIVEYEVAGNTVTETFYTTPVTILATEPGSYALISVSSANGCTGTVSTNVTINEITVDLTLNAVDPPCFGQPNGSITASSSGGNNPYTYVWQNGATGPSLGNLGPGTYAATVTDNNGCTAEQSVTLNEPPQLTASATSNGTIDCNNPTGGAELDVSGGTPGYTFNWSNGSNQQNPPFTNGGTYTVTVTDENNCTTTASVTIEQNTTPPVAAANFTGEINCLVTEITINGLGSSQGAPFSYEWSGPSFVCCETTLTPIVNEGGTYTLTVTNSENGCTATTSVTIPQNDNPPIANINPPNNIGCDMPVVTINGNGSSTGPGISYTWTTLDGNFVCCTNGLNPQINQAGTYTLVVTNALTGCTAETSVTITGNTDPPVAVANVTGTVTCYEPEILIDGSGSSEGGNFSYNWTTTNGNIVSGGNTLFPYVDEGGNYTLVVTNTDNNCTATVTVTVPENVTPPIAVANATGAIDCDNPTVTLNGNGSSTGPAFTYEWTTTNGNIVSGETTLNPVVNQGGTYTLVVTNTDNGCTAEDEVTIQADQDIPIANAGPDLVLNCYASTIQLQGSGSSGPGISIQWTANPGNIVSGGNTLTPTVNQAGTYTLVVTNLNNGCSTEDYVDVTLNFDQPDASIAPPGILTCYEEEIYLDAGSSTGNNLYFEWSTSNGNITGGANSPYPSVNEPGTYTLTLTDIESGCTDVAQVVVTQNANPPVANAGPNFELDCQTSQITLNGTGSSQGGSFTYWWETSDGNILNGETGLTPLIDQPGTYLLTVTNLDNGCTATDAVQVTADQDLPNADGGPDLVLDCNNPTIQLDGSFSSSGNGLVIQWTANPGNIVSGANTLTPTVDETGYYTLTITNPANGCSATDEVYVEDNILYPQPLIADPGQLNCAFQSVILDASGSSGDNLDFQWTTPNGNIISGSNSPYPEVDEPGAYFLTITNQDNACTATASVTVIQDVALPVATGEALGTLTCQFPQIELSGQGSSTGYQFFYEWSTNDGNIVSGHLTLNPTVNQPGTYTLVVYNIENGCESAVNVTVVTSQEFPTANAGPAQTITCTAAQLNLDGSASSQGPEFVYVWSTQNGNIVSGNNTLNPLVNAPGLYDLSVINTETGCVSTATVDVNVNTVLPTALVAPADTLSCVQTTVTLSGGGSSSGPLFNYLWTTQNGNIVSGDSTLNPQVNAVGTYTLLVTNLANGCTAVDSVSVAADASLPAANAGAGDTLNCLVAQLTLDGSGSSAGPDFQYQWNGPGILSGKTSLTPSVNQPGTYTLLVTNTTNGCTATDAVLVAADLTPPLADAGPDSLLNCYHPELYINGAGSSTGPQFTYQWATANGNILSGENTLNPLVNQPGAYSLTVTNTDNGCTGTDLVEMAINQTAPSAEAGPSGQITCSASTVTLNGTASMGPAITYFWSSTDGNIAGGDSTLAPVVDAPGLYTLLVTDLVNGCTATDSVAVGKDANVPTAAAIVPGELNCVTAALILNGANSSQGPGMIYHWSTLNGNIVSGDSTLTPTVNAPGQYTLVVYNTINDCSAQFTADVVLNLTPPVAKAGVPQVLSCLTPLLTLNGAGTSVGPNFSYQWTTQNGNIVSGDTTLSPEIDKAGFYRLVVTNTVNGCTASDLVQILLDQNTPNAVAGPAQELTCAITALSLNGAGTSVGPNFSYQWTTQNGSILGGETTLSPMIDAPGVYTLLVTNALNGCTALSSVTVTEDVAPPQISIAGPATLNCQLTAQNLDAAGSSSGSNFSYAWTTANGNILSGANTASPLIDAPGAYTLLITNTYSGCTASSAVDVDQDVALPTANAGPATTLTCSVTDIALQGTAQNTGPAFSIDWSTANGNIASGANTLNPVIDAPGLYTIVVTNLINFCSDTASVTIPQNANPPVVSIANAPVITCANPSVLLNGGGSSTGSPFTYQWSTNDGNILSGGTTLTPQVDAPGTYTLLVYNTQNDCSDTANVVVPINTTPPVAEAGAAATLSCTVTTLQLDGTGSSGGGPYTYQWTTANGLLTGGSTTLTPTVAAPGLYQLLVTNVQNGCTQTDQVTVPQDITAPDAAAATPGELTCTTTALMLSGAGSSAGAQYSYSWTGGSILSGENTLSPTVNAPATYTLVVTNSQNGCSAGAVVDVTQNIEAPQVEAGADAYIDCYLSQLALAAVATGGANGVGYAWTAGGGGNIVSGANSATPLINAGGIYSVVVTDLYNGCTASDALNIADNALPPVTLIAQPGQLTCLVASLVLDGSASSQGSEFQLAWTGPGLTGGVNTLTPQVNQPGLYQLMITNTDNGCVNTASVTVTQDIQSPAADAGNGFELTCTVEDGLLSAAGSASGPQIAYQWSTLDGNILSGANSAAPRVDAPGIYTLLVTNTATGCTGTDQTAVTVNTNVPAGFLLSNTPPACGQQPGSILFETVQGGVGPFLYSIDGGDRFLATPNFGGLAPGTYRLLVQDANGCEYEEMLEFPVPVEPTVTLPAEIQLAYGDSDKLIATINIPLSQVDTILWSPMEGVTPTNRPYEVSIQPFSSTQYTVRLINKDGCEDRATVFVRVDDPAIWAPNAFSPNRQDGENDFFTLFARDNTVREINSLQIYDRWGNQVFYRENLQPNVPKLGWDGHFRGQPMNPAVFVWWAKVELLSGQTILLKGDVTIVD